MEVCIQDVGSASMHFLFEVGIVKDPFELFSIV